MTHRAPLMAAFIITLTAAVSMPAAAAPVQQAASCYYVRVTNDIDSDRWVTLSDVNGVHTNVQLGQTVYGHFRKMRVVALHNNTVWDINSAGNFVNEVTLSKNQWYTLARWNCPLTAVHKSRIRVVYHG